MWMNAMGMIDGVLAHAAAGEVGGAVASGSILGLIPVTLMLFAAMLLFKGSKQSSDEKAQAFQAQRGQQGVAEGLDEAVGGNYLYHSTQDANTAKQILSSGYILGSNSGKQPASDAQTTLPTVSFGRSIGYQTSGVNVDRDYQVVFVFDRASIETRYKTLGTSQSQNVRGLANPIDTEWGGKVAKLGKVWGLDANADGKVDYKEIGNVSKSAASNMVKKGVSAKLNAPKAGGEFEEIVPTKTGKIPLQGLLVGFYLVPGKAASKDPELLNDPRRLDMPRPNQFVKATQAQGVAEGDAYIESLNVMLERQLEPTMDLDTWNNNFQNADPQKYHQFKNKTPEKKK
jgi:hypothetical protein